MPFFLAWHFLLKGHSWECDQVAGSPGSSNIELEPFYPACLTTGFREIRIAKYKWSDLSCAGGGEALHLFWRYENWSMKLSELSIKSPSLQSNLSKPMSSSSAIGALEKLESWQALISTKGREGRLSLPAFSDKRILRWKGTPRCAIILKERDTALGVPTLEVLVRQEGGEGPDRVWIDLGGCTIRLSSGSPSSCSAPTDLRRNSPPELGVPANGGSQGELPGSTTLGLRDDGKWERPWLGAFHSP